jgi:N-acetylglucosamine-6-phosphate deacetylase
MTKTITARYLVTADAVLDFPVVTLADDGTIAQIVSDPQALKDDTSTLTAAFLDIHTHGALGHDVMTATPSELSEMQRFLAARGVAHYLPTTVTDSVDNTLRALEALAKAVEGASGDNEATPVGIHLEGPFLSHAKRGVHPPHELQPPSMALFDRFWAAARGHISLMTIAPELPGAIELIAHAVSLGVKVSLGHSNATSAETLPAIAAGATSATHTFNAMRALEHREPGILGTVLDDDRLFAELICDGIHVAPPLVRLWLKGKSLSRAILVTDAMSATGMPQGQYSLAGQPVTVTSDRAVLSSSPSTLAGSILTMDLAVANLRAFTNSTIGDAARLATHNPAAMLGQAQLTSIAVGSPANLNHFDASGKLLGTYLRGCQLEPQCAKEKARHTASLSITTGS